MKNALIGLLLLGSISAFSQSYQTLMQSSANVIKAVTNYLVEDNNLMALRVREISATAGHAKAELIDAEGNCSALAFQVKANAQGKTTVAVNPAAFAICD